jgi:hypothetical protein
LNLQCFPKTHVLGAYKAQVNIKLWAHYVAQADFELKILHPNLLHYMSAPPHLAPCVKGLITSLWNYKEVVEPLRGGVGGLVERFKWRGTCLASVRP